MSFSKSHGSPFDRGRMDAYYGRPSNPHIWLDGCGVKKVLREDMTKDQINEYNLGFESEDDRKNWR